MAMLILSPIFFDERFRVAAPTGGIWTYRHKHNCAKAIRATTGLDNILATAAHIYRAMRRLKWPGEAAVIVSVVHVAKALSSLPILDERSGRANFGLSR